MRRFCGWLIPMAGGSLRCRPGGSQGDAPELRSMAALPPADPSGGHRVAPAPFHDSLVSLSYAQAFVQRARVRCDLEARVDVVECQVEETFGNVDSGSVVES